MTLNDNHSEVNCLNPEKYVSQLKVPAKKAKQALKDLLEKSVKRFQEEADKSTSDKKHVFMKKKERVCNELDVLKVLSEEEIIRYALLKLDKIMKIASNPRTPREEKMKARVAAHKPLFSHLARLKHNPSTVQEKEESESEDEPDDGGSTLNKITFNYTVVAMRKDVRRSKVHVIHKLTRRIKILRDTQGNEEKVAKCQEKAEKLRKKVIHIKELHEDEISRFALSTTQNLNQLANDMKAPSKSQALATVAMYKFVAEHVNDFKTKYPDWQKIVPNLLKKKNKKRKLKLETKDENTHRKLSQQNTESENSQSGSESDPSGSEKDDESDNSELEENSESEDMTSVGKGSENESDSDDEVSNSSDNVVNVKSETNNKSKKTKGPRAGIESLDDIPKVSNKATANKEISKTKQSKKHTSLSSPLPIEVKPVENKVKVIDPFFVTTTNEEYVTSQVPPSSENDGKTKPFETNKGGKFDNSGYRNKWERTSNERNYGKFNRLQGSAPYSKKPSASGFDKFPAGPKTDKLVFGNRKERRKALQQPQAQEKTEKLHPSWEAKKKQLSIIPFQGKKVKFD